MHSIELKIDESIFDKVMTMLELLPQDKVKVEDLGYEYPPVAEKEARKKVQKAISTIGLDKSLSLEEAFGNILKR